MGHDQCRLVLVYSLNVSTASSSEIVVYKDKIWFSDRDSLNNENLFVSDGTAAGTTVFAPVPGSYNTGKEQDVLYNIYSKPHLTLFGDKLAFEGDLGGFRSVLWTTDGTLAGTKALAPQDENARGVFDGFNYNGDSGPRLAALGASHAVYFTGSNAAGKIGLWVSDGTSAGTHAIASVNSAGDSLFPTYITRLGHQNQRGGLGNLDIGISGFSA